MTLPPSDSHGYTPAEADQSGPLAYSAPTPKTAWVPMRHSHWRGIDLNDEAGRWLMANDPAYWTGRCAGVATAA